MTWVDGAALAVVAVSALVALSRGLVHEVLGLAAWAGAVFAGLALREGLAPMFEPMVGEPWIAEAIAGAGAFLVVLIVLKLLVGAIARRVQDSALGGTDRALGLVFGAARGAALVVLAYILGGMVLPATDRWPEAVRGARALPLVGDGAAWAIGWLPPDVRPRLPTGLDRAGPTHEQLLRPPARNRT